MGLVLEWWRHSSEDAFSVAMGLDCSLSTEEAEEYHSLDCRVRPASKQHTVSFLKNYAKLAFVH